MCVCLASRKEAPHETRDWRKGPGKTRAGNRGLTGLSVRELKDRWRTLYGSEPHQRISRELLTRAIAYRIQELALGGLKPSMRRLLERIAESASSRQTIRAVPVRNTPRRTVLIREWQGVSHQVTVVDDAVVYREQRYGSLSEVARVIIGTRWSSASKCMLRSVVIEGAKLAIRRCAVYMRKSSEEGLEQDFNSLHAQREAWEAFIKS